MNESTSIGSFSKPATVQGHNQMWSARKKYPTDFNRSWIGLIPHVFPTNPWFGVYT